MHPSCSMKGTHEPKQLLESRILSHHAHRFAICQSDRAIGLTTYFACFQCHLQRRFAQSCPQQLRLIEVCQHPSTVSNLCVTNFYAQSLCNRLLGLACNGPLFGSSCTPFACMPIGTTVCMKSARLVTAGCMAAGCCLGSPAAQIAEAV